MDSSRRYALLAYAGKGFCDFFEAVDDTEAAATFMRRDRRQRLGCWNADLWSVDDRYPVVVVRADIEQSWQNEWIAARARARWLYVRDGPYWRVSHVDFADLGAVTATRC